MVNETIKNPNNSPNKKNIFIKFLAYFFLICGAILFFVSLVASVLAWFYFRESLVYKKIILDLVIIFVGFLCFLVGVGLFQYLNSFIKFEKEMEEIEKEMEKLGEEIKGD